MAMEIRPPGDADVPAIWALLASNGWGHRVVDAAWLAKLIESSHALVATENGRILGFARAVTDGLSNGYLSMVVVAPESRHQGIGSTLVREITGRDPGVTWVLRASRPGAREFFESFGFRASSQAMELHRGSGYTIEDRRMVRTESDGGSGGSGASGRPMPTDIHHATGWRSAGRSDTMDEGGGDGGSD